MMALAILGVVAIWLSADGCWSQGYGAVRRHEGIELKARGGRLVHCRTTASERET